MLQHSQFIVKFVKFDNFENESANLLSSKGLFRLFLSKFSSKVESFNKFDKDLPSISIPGMLGS